MGLPTALQTTLPILKSLSTETSAIQVHDLYKKTLNHEIKLTEEERQQKMPKGVLYINDRLSWGKTFLKKVGLVEYPTRGYVKITTQGLDLLTKKITLDELIKLIDDAYKADDEAVPSESDVGSPTESIADAVHTIEQELSNNLLEKLQSTNPYYFEKIVLKLFKEMRYGDFAETSKSGDKGIDGIMTEDALGFECIYVQAKRYQTGNLVREPEIRNFIGAMSGDVRKGIFVTTSSFHDLAIKKAETSHNHKIMLIDGKRLVALMIKYNIGVQIKDVYETKEIDIDFFEEDT